MKFIFILFLFLNFSAGIIHSQNLTWIMPTHNDYQENHIEIDSQGNIYTLTMNAYSGNIISKYSTNGNWLWSKKFDPVTSTLAGLYEIKGLAVDSKGDIFLTGDFTNTVDFDPGPGVFNMLASGGVHIEDIFIVKLNSQGILINAVKIGGTSVDYSNDIIIDDNDNIYITGGFKGTSDFDPGPGVYNLSSGSSFAGTNIFSLKLDNNLNFIWARHVLSNYGAAQGFAIDVDNLGNVYTTGQYWPNSDFDPGPGVYILPASTWGDYFIQKLDQNGNFVWAKGFGDVNDDYGKDVAVDKLGNVYTLGRYKGIVDFDPGPGVHWDTSYNYDIFLNKFNSNGDFDWAIKLKSSYSWDIPFYLKLDKYGDVYISCSMGDITDFDPGPGVYNLPKYSSSGDFIMVKYSSSGNLLEAHNYGRHNVSGKAGYFLVDENLNIYFAGGFNDTIHINSSVNPHLIVSDLPDYKLLLKLHQKGVSGKVFNDLNINCVKESQEIDLAGRTIIIQPGNIVAQTNSSGIYYIDSLPIGNYIAEIDTSNGWNSSCAIQQNFSVVDPTGITYGPSFGLKASNACPAPDISIHAPFIRPGFSNQKVYVSACNKNIGSDFIVGSDLEIELDSLLSVQSASGNYTSLGNNKFLINIDTLYPGECMNFFFECILSSAAVIGQTLCMSAVLNPVKPCMLDTIPSPFPSGITPCSTVYDSSHIDINKYCLNDSIYIIISNTGAGNMSCFSQIRIFVDAQLLMLDSIKLDTSESDTLILSGDGRTWRIEVDQHPLHPGNSQPNATMERCGNLLNWTPNLVNILPHDDADPVIDIYCGLVTGSFDPNDKSGFPLGVDSNHHYIYQNQDIEYLIRFQNTGTDTAFTVVIRDTLPMELDIFSVTPGASSHNYSFEMHGPRVLEWTFNEILLPDSSISQEGSNGFVKYKVKQNKNLALGTVINNSASIYFDFNFPIITNTYYHTIENHQGLSWVGKNILTIESCSTLVYNNVAYDKSGVYFQNSTGLDSLIIINLTVKSVDTSLFFSNSSLIANAVNASYQWIYCDSVAVQGETSQTFTPAENGRYAVVITQNGCVDTSSCYTISGIGINESHYSDFKIYPNPTDGNLTLDLGATFGEITISVKNIYGQIIKQYKDYSVSKLDIPINGSSGIYIIEVATGDQKPYYFKVVKN